MDDSITPFNFDGADVRVVMHHGEPWFVAADVCAVLGLTDGKTSIRRLDPDEVHSMPLEDSARRLQEQTIISESGLYSLALRSRRPEAKRFKKWVTAEVLPSIRKTGLYVATAAALVAPTAPDWMGPVMAALTQNLTALTSQGGEVKAIALGAATTADAARAATEDQARELDELRAQIADRDIVRRQQLRGEVEVIKKQVFKAMTARGVGIQKVAHDFWESTKARADVRGVAVSELTVSMAERLLVESRRQAIIWGVDLTGTMPLNLAPDADPSVP